jgi:hypothetical protein
LPWRAPATLGHLAVLHQCGEQRHAQRPKPDGYGYAVFGKVVKGMDVVDKIRAVATGNRGMHQNVPTTPVILSPPKSSKQPGCLQVCAASSLQSSRKYRHEQSPSRTARDHQRG